MKEVRNTTFEIRAIEPESRMVTGYAIVFNAESTGISGFTEIISPTALEGVIERSDVLCLLNHNEDKGVLARCKNGSGSLSLEIDERGLKYSFEAPNTALGDELIEGLKRGDITTSSFAFTVADGGESWTKKADGTYLRTITAFDMIFDVSPVYRAAYDATSVKVDSRGLDAIKASERAELEDYFKELRAKLK
ncbi:MAG: HK97 family phage prohead protease [Lachnospiraceae bacterium]|nr:HK97 family phage prohead protease [Lachnospiraceae bacterium]